LKGRGWNLSRKSGKTGPKLGTKDDWGARSQFLLNRQPGKKLDVRFLVSKVTVAGLVGVAQFFRGLYWINEVR
jgi:hypothetical protein